jgi:hypothetical protein
MSEGTAAPAAGTPAPVTAEAPATDTAITKQAEGSKADTAGAKATAEAIRKFKVKVNDVEEEVSEDDLIAGYQTRKSSDAKFQEAATLRKQAEQFVHMLKTDPVKLLTHPALGHDMRKLAEEYLGKQLQEELMDPKDKEIRDIKAKLAEHEEAKKAVEKEEQDRQATQLREQYIEDYTKDFIPALETAGLPKSEMTVRRMAYYTHAALKQGIKLPAQNAAELVKQDYIKEQQALYGALDGDMLLQLLGPEIAKKIRKYDVDKLKGGNQVKVSTGVELKSTETPAKKKTLSKDEWKAKMDRIRSGQE